MGSEFFATEPKISTLVLFSTQQMKNRSAQQYNKRMFLISFKPWDANQAGADLPAHDNPAAGCK